MSDGFPGENAPALEGGVCTAHGPFARDISWTLTTVQNVFKLGLVSTGVLIGIFGAVLKFGMDMTGGARQMQEQLIALRSDVTKLEATDTRICSEIDKLKDRNRWRRNAVGAGGADAGADD